jgi:uncharacterized protein YlaI
MKKIKTALATLLLTAISTAYAIDLSLNQSEFSAGDPLTLTLTNEVWSGEADIYIALTLPADETLYFLTPSGLVLDLLPFQQVQIAAGSRVILQIASLAPLPPGQYTFYAGVTVPDTLDIIGEIAMNSVNFVAEKLDVSDISFPDGVVGRTYSFAIEPNSGMPPYQFSLISGTLPDGLTLSSESGLIQGTPSERGSAELTVQVTDARGDVAEIEGVLNVFGVLTFGEHGTFKGCDGLQMAFNASQDLDEIRIEQGTYECHGLEIPEGKDWAHGIKISGGWGSSFENQSDDPAVTVFDGKGEGSILKVSSGVVTIEGLSFQNGTSEAGGAIYAGATVNITIMCLAATLLILAGRFMVQTTLSTVSSPTTMRVKAGRFMVQTTLATVASAATLLILAGRFMIQTTLSTVSSPTTRRLKAGRFMVQTTLSTVSSPTTRRVKAGRFMVQTTLATVASAATLLILAGRFMIQTTLSTVSSPITVLLLGGPFGVQATLSTVPSAKTAPPIQVAHFLAEVQF